MRKPNQYTEGISDWVSRARQAALGTIPDSSPLSTFPNYYITVNDLPALTEPLVRYMHDFEPHVALASDRGGRYVGLAVFGGWKRLYPDKPFPTLDGKLHFARMRGSTGEGEVAELLGRSSLLQVVAGSENPTEEARIMFIDDWVLEGKSVERFRINATKWLGSAPDVRVATLIDTTLMRPDVVGDTKRWARTTTWENKNRAVGVRYDRAGYPHPQAGVLARSMRRRLYRALDRHYEA